MRPREVIHLLRKHSKMSGEDQTPTARMTENRSAKKHDIGSGGARIAFDAVNHTLTNVFCIKHVRHKFVVCTGRH